MTLSIDIILYLIAALLFGLAGFGVKGSVDWVSLGFMVLALSLAI